MSKAGKLATLRARRTASLDAVPCRTPVVRTATTGAKLHVTVRLLCPKWQRWLGGATTVDRTFGLDKYGRLVYEACDGQRTIRQLIRFFADATHISQPEAETAVTKFVHTLISKGLIVIEMENPSHE